MARSPATQGLNRSIEVPHSGPTVAITLDTVPSPWVGDWSDTDAVPWPRPDAQWESDAQTLDDGALPGQQPLEWNRWIGLPEQAVAPSPVAPRPALRPKPTTGQPLRRPQPTKPVPAPVSPAPAAPLAAQSAVNQAAQRVGPYADGMAQLVGELEQTNRALTDAHAAFLAGQEQAQAQLAGLGNLLENATAALLRGEPVPDLAIGQTPVPSAGRGVQVKMPSAPKVAKPVPADRFASGVPRSFDYDDLVRHASGKISEVFGPTYADLDPYEPRVRMPEHPMLLCSRVLTVEGERGQLGPARIVTEYDVPHGQPWSVHDGKPSCCVVVESGQADLFLVSFLGIDEHCKGDRVYRLLDCDLTFHGERPHCGETLRHDIRIKSFAKLGGKVLFYFEYDCISTTTQRPVLTMRNGCAGFFSYEELATPQGVRIPPNKRLGQAPSPIATTSVTTLDETGMAALVQRRFSDAFGPDFADADGSTLTLPDSEWRLAHRVSELTLDGGPHGFGQVTTEQDLRDDDWFNPCHFKGDPCMPGTLMLDGCMQAVQLWMLGAGIATEFPEATFEPLPETAFKLRCRGQVVPGQSLLQYTARIKEARLDGDRPYALADVILTVDGTPVVMAEDVGVVVVGQRVPRALPVPTANVDKGAPIVDEKRVMEYSVGSAVAAFGPAYADFDGDGPGARCARMPGPPYLTMTRVRDVEGPAGEVAQGRSVTIEYDVPADSWYFRAFPECSMPFAVLLETALQPCGWITAWQQAGIKNRTDLYFRNLGGTATQHREVWPGEGTLTTKTTQTTFAESAGLLIHRFELEMVDEAGAPVFTCSTSFGYFTAAALNGQKGLLPPKKEEERRDEAKAQHNGRITECADHPSFPRSDWRMLDRVIVHAPEAGLNGLGFYEAEKVIDPDEWFFTAHFHLDPVMPGSLGLEALLQLARYVLEDRTGQKLDRIEPILVGEEVNWRYRGQVRRPVKRQTVELEVLSIEGGERPRIVCNGWVRADGMPIYEFKDFGVQAGAPMPADKPAARKPRGPHHSALIDRFEVQGDQGTGIVRLDPASHPWLADHCPTLTAPAVPLAFAAEIAAEAAQLLAPDAQVIGVPDLTADKWIHTAEGPVDLHIAAVRQGQHVAVSLAVHVENKRFPKLSGPKTHMKAVVELGNAWHPAPSAPQPLKGAKPAGLSIDAYYGGGLTFHGPVLQGMTDLGTRSKDGAESTFVTRPDADLLGTGDRFLLDPLLLDTATHPMMSGEPEIWVDGLEHGKLAYPMRCQDLKLHGPRPQGEVRCALRKVHADAHSLVFDVQLIGANGPWCSFRWTEALVEGGPILGQPTPVRKAFQWDKAPSPEVRIGSATADGWRVTRDDLVEPLEGTLVGLYCTPREIRQYKQAVDRIAWATARLAAKEAVRSWLQQRLGRDVHPTRLEMLDMRDDLYVVIETPSLTAQEYIDNLGPTRFDLVVDARGSEASARVVPR